MKEISKALCMAILVISAAFIIWIMVSWADVLAHQFHGGAHSWNAFSVLIECYERLEGVAH